MAWDANGSPIPNEGVPLDRDRVCIIDLFDSYKKSVAKALVDGLSTEEMDAAHEAIKKYVTEVL